MNKEQTQRDAQDQNSVANQHEAIAQNDNSDEDRINQLSTDDQNSVANQHEAMAHQLPNDPNDIFFENDHVKLYVERGNFIS
jgi:hypothetical protein